MKKPRVTAEETFKRRMEILCYLKLHGPLRSKELNKRFNQYDRNCLLCYLQHLRAKGNIIGYKSSSYGFIYKFIKYPKL